MNERASVFRDLTVWLPLVIKNCVPSFNVSDRRLGCGRDFPEEAYRLNRQFFQSKI